MKHPLEAMKMTYNPFRPSERSLRRRVFGFFASKRSVLGAFIAFSMVLAGIASSSLPVAAQDAGTPSGYTELTAAVQFAPQSDNSYSVTDSRRGRGNADFTRSLAMRGTCSLNTADIRDEPTRAFRQWYIKQAIAFVAWRNAGNPLWQISYFNNPNSKDTRGRTGGFPLSDNEMISIGADLSNVQFVAGGFCTTELIGGTVVGRTQVTSAISNYLNDPEAFGMDVIDHVHQPSIDENPDAATRDFFFEGYADVVTAAATATPGVPIAQPNLSSVTDSTVTFAFRGADANAFRFVAGYRVDDNDLGTGVYLQTESGQQTFTHTVEELSLIHI